MVTVENGIASVVAIDRVAVKDTSLPKGHQEPGESLQQTAIREVLEETGFRAKPVEYLGEFTYEVKNDANKKITMVTVHWFLMLIESGKPRKVNNVKTLKKGVYHFNVKNNSIEQLRKGSNKNFLVDNTGQSFVGDSSCVIILSAVLDRTRIKYEERGYRFILMECGHVAQNLYLISEAMRLKCCAIGGFVDEEFNKLLDIHGIDVLQQTIRYPLLKNVELQKEKQSVTEEINKDRFEPNIAVWDYAWNEAFWRGSSLARPYTGNVNDLNDISITDVQKFIDEISFNKGVLCIAGNFDTNYALNIVEKYFGDIKNKGKNAAQKIAPHKGGSLKILPNNTDNTYLMFGFKTIKKDHNDTHALRLISRLLGGSFSGILVNELREKGFIYDWVLDQDLLQETGYIYFKTSTGRKFLNETIKQICYSFKRVAKGKFSKEEFEIAQSQTIGELLLNMETTADYNGWYGEQEFLSGKSYTPQEIAKIYKEITIDSVAKVAKKYFTANNWYLGLVGKASPKEIERELIADVEPTVEMLGKIRELNVGKRMNIDRTRYVPLD